MMMEATRRERRRAGSKRARARATRAKVDEFLQLHHQGHSTSTIARKLNYRVQDVLELEATIAEAGEHQPEAVEAGGGGG